MGIAEIRKEYGGMADEIFEKIKSGFYSDSFGRELIREVIVKRDKEIRNLYLEPLPVENKRWMFLKRRNIFPNGRRYLTRFILIQTPMFGIYIHKFMDSDEDRCLHDHPWNFLSVILKGRYTEHTDEGQIIRNRWSVAYREAKHQHRVELIDRESFSTRMVGPNDVWTFNFKPVWTLMFVSRRVRPWGFWPLVRRVILSTTHETKHWCHWKKYNLENGICENGNLINEGEN